MKAPKCRGISITSRCDPVKCSSHGEREGREQHIALLQPAASGEQPLRKAHRKNKKSSAYTNTSICLLLKK